MPDDVAFEPADAAAIKTAILGHRKLRVNSQPLERLLYAADKRRAPALHAPRAIACNWSMIKKNLSISRVVSLRGRGSKRRRRSR